MSCTGDWYLKLREMESGCFAKGLSGWLLVVPGQSFCVRVYPLVVVLGQSCRLRKCSLRILGQSCVLEGCFLLVPGQ